MFSVNSISIRYDQKTIIRDFSFKVTEGEIVSIIGPNGSGKSTLLKAVSRQLPYFEGTVELDGMNLKSMSPKQVAQKMCMLSQKNTAPPDMTVNDLVSYGRYPHKKSYRYQVVNRNALGLRWHWHSVHRFYCLMNRRPIWIYPINMKSSNSCENSIVKWE